MSMIRTTWSADHECIFPGNNWCRLVGIDGELPIPRSRSTRKIYGTVAAALYNSGRHLYADPKLRFPGHLIDSQLTFLPYRKYHGQGDFVHNYELFLGTEGHRSMTYDSEVVIEMVGQRPTKHWTKKGQVCRGTTSTSWKLSLPAHASCYLINAHQTQLLFVRENFFLPGRFLRLK